MAPTEDQITAAFKKNGLALREDGHKSRLSDLAARFGLTAKKLSSAYDSFSIESAGVEGTGTVTTALLDAFETHLRTNAPEPDAITPIRADKPLGTPYKRAEETNGVLADHSNLSLLPSLRTPTPGKKVGGSAVKRARLSSAFKDRQQRGQVQATLNEHITPETDAQPMDVDGRGQQGGLCDFRWLGERLHADARYMVDTIDDKVVYLDSRIREFGAALEAQGLGTPQPVSAVAQTEGLFVGRVCCDGEGRLNEQSALLEGDLATSNGARVKLDTSRLQSVRLFPGQVIGVVGKNPTGACVAASALHSAAPLPLPCTPPQAVAKHGAGTLGVIAAAGPFTTAADLSFEALEELLATVGSLDLPPAALLLLGPFLEAQHPSVASGQLEAPFQQVFEQEFLGRVGEWASTHPRTRVMLASSTRDVVAAPVFPTPPLRKPPGVALPHNVMMLPNPATFALGEVVFGVVTSDIVKALSGAETARSAPGDRLAALATHVLAQRSYFPVFPPPPGAMLDTKLAAKHLGLPTTPDVLVLPSDLTAFAKLLDVTVAAADAKVVCVNPGRLTKGVTGGSWTHLQIRASDEAEAIAKGTPTETNAPVPHRVDCRCRVDIKRI